MNSIVLGFGLLMVPLFGLQTLAAATSSRIPWDGTKTASHKINMSMAHETASALRPLSSQRSVQREVRDDSATSNNGTNDGDFALQMNETWYWNMNGRHHTLHLCPSPSWKAHIFPAKMSSLISSLGTSTRLAKLSVGFESSNGTKPWNGMAMALENVMDDVANLTCSPSNNEMSIQWKDHDSYESAKASWDWVNQESGRYIGMVVNSPACGGYRRPYKVSSCNATESDLTINMAAKAVGWDKTFPFMNLSLSTSGLMMQSEQENNDARDLHGLDKRANVDIPLAHDFSGTNIFSENVSDTLDVSLTCGTCMTTGSINIDLEVSTDILKFPPVDGTITVTTTGVSATVGLDLLVSAALTSEVDETVTFLNVPLIDNPLSVAGIASIGPSLMVNM